MQRNITQLHGVTPEQLKSEIVSEIKEYLDKKFANNEDKDELLTRKQVAKLLSISLPTLRNYTKRGLIKEYRIGSRVLYKSTEVIEALPEANKRN
ncbi:helix-turn-helix domain-containing protein [Polaribacter porphyrae]|uniref:Helix-turn-helix domain-containing protein n=1 Tax=Polaribacter porphyrae TaxID=1137780 RepID=A0A2S7WQ09_9FLAO|nr:helix-turn-helix domain-containing protein [Polaribacter porphyrae]PQJ79402.1 hypothetical protein BTO18_09555 [Polaribacter porphyrae]